MNRSIISASRHWLVETYQDREYFSRLVRIALPIALQQFIMSSLNMVSVVMIGQLGEENIAAAGLANQIFFLLNLLLFGITSGSAMFTAQLWGRQDIPNIHKVQGLCLMLGLAGGVFFLVVAVVFPEAALSIYTRDAQVIALGSQYLRIFGWSFVPLAITFTYAAITRSTGDVKTPMVVSITALSVNISLAYLLIFGKFGLPEMGIRGAATGILIARLLECCALLWLTYHWKTPAAAKLSELFRIDTAFTRNVLRSILPVAVNEVLWSLGITAYNVVYARISTDAIAAMNIVNSIDQLAVVVFIGVASACAILVGNRIGAGEERKASQYAGRSLALGAFGATLTGVVILLAAPYLLTLYKVSPIVVSYARSVLTIVGLLLWLRVSNMILFLGILRSGGDTRFALILDGFIIWLVGVPLAFAGAFLFHLPVYWVYLLVMTEELTKFVLAVWRFFSGKWIHNLTRSVQSPSL